MHTRLTQAIPQGTKIWKESIEFLTGFGRFGICFTSVFKQSLVQNITFVGEICFNSNQSYQLLTLVNTLSQNIALQGSYPWELVEEVFHPFPNHFGKGELLVLRRVDLNFGWFFRCNFIYLMNPNDLFLCILSSGRKKVGDIQNKKSIVQQDPGRPSFFPQVRRFGTATTTGKSTS